MQFAFIFYLRFLMKINHIDQFYKILRKDNLSFIYQGDFSDGITEKIIALSEFTNDSDNEMLETRNKVSFVIVECFQNIVRHGNDTQTETSKTISFPGLFSIRNTQESIYIASANLIENEQIPLLRDKLENLNNLDKEQIKALYMDILTTGELSEKGGAGLGLVEMARKSENPLEFVFEKENDKLSLFYLMLKMQRKVEGNCTRIEHCVKNNISLADVKQMHEIMKKENILLVYKGDFSQGTIIPVLKIIEDNLNKQQEELHIKKKLFLVLMEILQNISKHAVILNGKKEAVFMIGKKDQKYIICTGNMVDSVSAEKISKKINMVNSLNKQELAGLYMKTLKESMSVGEGAGLGIVDIARESAEKLEFNFTPETENLALFSFSVQL